MKDLPCGLDLGPCKKGKVTGCDRAQLASPYFGAQATPDNVHWICSGTINPSAEICNGVDDDCDGTPDDGVPNGGPCGTGLGECEPGVLVCTGGTMVCTGGTGPAMEACNALDDDCDGPID